MRNLIHCEDLKTLLQGAAVVAVAGLLMGAVAHPNLRGEDEAAGPQMLMNGGGERGAQVISDPGVGVYGGRIPEYVVGTDWTRPRAEPAGTDATLSMDEPMVDTGPAVVFADSDDPAQLRMTRTTWQDAPRDPTTYPSARGGVSYEANLPAPPPAPEGEDLALDLG